MIEERKKLKKLKQKPWSSQTVINSSFASFILQTIQLNLRKYIVK